MANTFILIQTQTVGSGGAASVTFSSIPQTYTDLKIVGSSRVAAATIYGTVNISFNAVTTNLSNRYLEGNGASAYSGTESSRLFATTGVGASATANTFSNFEVYIPNYAGSNNKSISVDAVSENNETTTYANLAAGLWAVTDAITEIKLDVGGATLVQYSSFSLYGIKKN